MKQISNITHTKTRRLAAGRTRPQQLLPLTSLPSDNLLLVDYVGLHTRRLGLALEPAVYRHRILTHRRGACLENTPHPRLLGFCHPRYAAGCRAIGDCSLVGVSMGLLNTLDVGRYGLQRLFAANEAGFALAGRLHQRPQGDPVTCFHRSSRRLRQRNWEDERLEENLDTQSCNPSALIRWKSSHDFSRVTCTQNSTGAGLSCTPSN